MSVRDKGGRHEAKSKVPVRDTHRSTAGAVSCQSGRRMEQPRGVYELIIGDQEWLKAYDNITVTPWTYADVDTASVGPNFVQQFIEGAPGTVTSAVAILTNYADEPDWKMDQDLNLSPLQVLTGGSQGWRHQYYGLGWLRLGVAPSRAQYFFDLAGKANEKRDLYWTFRYLARALHYVQDTTEPYHGVPAPAGLIFKGIGSFSTLMGSALNHHYNLEGYQGAMIAHGSPMLENALLTAVPLDTMTATSANWLCRKGACLGRPLCEPCGHSRTSSLVTNLTAKTAGMLMKPPCTSQTLAPTRPPTTRSSACRWAVCPATPRRCFCRHGSSSACSARPCTNCEFP